MVVMVFNREAIHTYEDGRPIEGRPDPLPVGSTVGEYFEHQRLWYRYEDKVADVQLRAFATQFAKSLRR